jgi:hypothetical protein
MYVCVCALVCVRVRACVRACLCLCLCAFVQQGLRGSRGMPNGTTSFNCWSTNKTSFSYAYECASHPERPLPKEEALMVSVCIQAC